jgi:maltooligosyltrehalose trehalohydrolase
LTSPIARTVSLQEADSGYYEAVVEGVGPGQRYRYVLDDAHPLPDPASRSQPEGVHGPSEVVESPDIEFNDWRNPSLRSYVIYELHVGTFSSEGTFGGVTPQLSRLRDLGVTAVELMPVAEFPGSRNWGYDGVFPYAPESAYGGPTAFQRLVAACHETGLAVILDVVYNHLGPEGNYLGRFGPYFTDAYQTPWGQAMNFSGPGSDEVRRFFIENALYWTDECRVDALRLDAIHAIVDPTADPFLAQLSDRVHERAASQARDVYLIAESASNDPRVCWSTAEGGLGMDAHWNDDFHHALRVALTREGTDYYQDFNGTSDLQTVLAEGYVYQGQYSRFRQRSHGRPPDRLNAEQLVIYSANHDQVGNRARGDRPSSNLDLESLKLAAGLTLLSPFVPLIFMGQEYSETAPFPYFVSHGDAKLVQAVRKGRANEFQDALGSATSIPDPQAAATFESAKLDHTLVESGSHRVMWDFYRELLKLRRHEPLLLEWPFESVAMSAEGAGDEVLAFCHQSSERIITCVFNFSWEEEDAELAKRKGDPVLLLYSAESRWGGSQGAGEPVRVTAGSMRVRLASRSFAVLSEPRGAIA